MGKKQRKRELKRLWRYTESLNAWFESALNRCEDLVGALEKTRGASTCSEYGPGVGSDSVVKLSDDVQQSDNATQPEEPIRIFSGDYSGKMWDAINNARTKEDLRGALYFVCCRLQEFESLNEHGHQRTELFVEDLNIEVGDCVSETEEVKKALKGQVAHFKDGVWPAADLAETVPMDSRGPAYALLSTQVQQLEQSYQKLKSQSDWLQAAYGEFQCGIKAECTNERCAQAQRCAHCAVSLGEAYERAGIRMAQFEDRFGRLEQERDNDLGETGGTADELCASCDRRYRTVWRALNNLWATIGYGGDDKHMCPGCFDRHARRAGIELYWECRQNHYPTQVPMDSRGASLGNELAAWDAVANESLEDLEPNAR